VTHEPESEPGHGTPEGYTAEKPAPSEIGKPGTPGAVDDEATADSVEHAATSFAHDDVAPTVTHHDASTHMEAHASISDDDHGHAEAKLGPVDWVGWGYALIGAAAALVVVALFWVAVQ
jgi:hypothetical protein